MSERIFRLAEQIGEVGFFAELSAEATITPVVGLAVEYETSAQAWRAGIEFGLHFAYEKRPASLLHVGYKLRVTGIKDHVVDTTQVVMSYVAAMLMFEVLGAPPSVEFRRDIGAFVFFK